MNYLELSKYKYAILSPSDNDLLFFNNINECKRYLAGDYVIIKLDNVEYDVVYRNISIKGLTYKKYFSTHQQITNELKNVLCASDIVKCKKYLFFGPKIEYISGYFLIDGDGTYNTIVINKDNINIIRILNDMQDRAVGSSQGS